VKRRLTEAVTSLAAQTFPPSRRADGRVVRDCARDAIDAAGLRAMVRETASVAFAGLRVRWGVSVRDVRQAPWRPALGVLTLPLAAALLGVWTFGFVPRYDHWPLGEGWWMLLGGSLLVERVFEIPGVGSYAFNAIGLADLPAIQGTVLFAAFFIIVANLVVDVAYAFVDPRVRYS
jgi:hypothetical protein